MAPEASPAFQFYPKEFLTDGNVAGMSLTERGAYITLLCLCWQECSLPTDLQRLAHMVGLTRSAFVKLWPAMVGCFVEQDGRLIHRRLNKEREKQAEYRRRQSAAGKKSAAARQPEVNHGSTMVEPTHQPTPQPKPKSPISDLRSPISDPVPTEPVAVNARSKRPIFFGQRFVVFEWQFDDLTRMLGEHTDAFDLHRWFFDLDTQAGSRGLVIPQRDNSAWLQAQTLAEAQRRGLPIAAASAPTAGKLTTRLALAMENIRREAES